MRGALHRPSVQTFSVRACRRMPRPDCYIRKSFQSLTPPCFAPPLTLLAQIIQALTAALELGHSNRVLRILNSVLVEAPEGSDATAQHDLDNEPVTPSQQGRKLDRYVSKFNDDECTKLVSFCKEWNTNSRNAHLSQLALSSLLRTLGVERLLSIKQIANAVPALLAYSERHFQRIDRLHQAAYALEYISGLMSLLPVAETAADKNGSGSKGVAKRKRAQLIIFGDQHTSTANASESESESDSNSASVSTTSRKGKGSKVEKADKTKQPMKKKQV